MDHIRVRFGSDFVGLCRRCDQPLAHKGRSIASSRQVPNTRPHVVYMLYTCTPFAPAPSSLSLPPPIQTLPPSHNHSPMLRKLTPKPETLHLNRLHLDAHAPPTPHLPMQIQISFVNKNVLFLGSQRGRASDAAFPSGSPGCILSR
jgi:hypothetical protein